MMQRILAFLLLSACFGCTKNPSAEELISNSIHAITYADTIRNFITEADCQGPKGAYKTIVHSDRDYTYFKQVFGYGGDPFEAVIVHDSAFQVVNDSVGSSFGQETITALKSHEFHMILIDLKDRFHQFSKPETVSDQLKINAIDELNNPIEIFFRKDAPEIQSITMRNPGDTTERISFTYADWKIIQGVKLPMRVTLKQGADKTFTFDFINVMVNSKDFKRWNR